MSTLSRPPDGEVIAIMVVWNGLPFLAEGVASVLRELRPQDDLLIVDNGSTDGSAEWVHQHYPNVALLQTSRNLGGAGGFNAGMTVALRCLRCRYAWLLDNDIIIEAGALPPLLDQLSAEPDAAAAGSQICLYSQADIVQEIGAQLSPWLGTLRQRGAGGPRQGSDQPPTPVDYLAACSLLIRADALRTIGPFPDFFIYYDDVEWGQRARRAGWTLWAVPASVIRHHFSGLKPVAAWREYYRKRNRTVFLALHPPRRGRAAALFIYLIHLRHLILYARWRGHTAFAQTYLAALQDALAGQLGVRQLPPPPPGPGDIPPDIQTAPTVWIDMPGQRGDALAIIRLLQDRAPTVATKVVGEPDPPRLATPPGPGPSHSSRPPSAAIVGEGYRLRTALRAAVVYQCRDGQFLRLCHPLRRYVALQLLRAAALLVASVQAIPDYWRVRSRYRHGLPPPPLD